MNKIKLFLAGAFILILLAGCKSEEWVTPSNANNTVNNPGTNAWFNNRMDQEQMSDQINQNNFGSDQNGGNFETNVGVQP